MIQLKKLSQEEIALLSKQLRERVELSPAQKFAIIQKEYDSKKVKMKKWHFKAIEHGIKIYLFNGLGNQLRIFENSFSGKRECRAFAFEEFKTAEFMKENINGGYRFDFV